MSNPNHYRALLGLLLAALLILAAPLSIGQHSLLAVLYQSTVPPTESSATPPIDETSKTPFLPWCLSNDVGKTSLNIAGCTSDSYRSDDISKDSPVATAEPTPSLSDIESLGSNTGTELVAANAYQRYLPLLMSYGIPLYDAYEPDNLYSSAKQTSNGTLHGPHSISPVGDSDWIRFVVSQTSEIYLVTYHPTRNDDTRLWLYNSALTSLKFDDDSGVNLYSQLSYPCAPAGTYYALVDDYGSNSVIPEYYLSLYMLPCNVSENETLGNDSAAQANNNPQSQALRYPPTEFTGLTDDDKDYYRVVARAAGRLEVTLFPTTQNGLLQLALRTADVNSPPLRYVSQAPYTISYNLPSAGTYYIQVYAATPNSASYTLRFTAIP